MSKQKKPNEITEGTKFSKDKDFYMEEVARMLDAHKAITEIRKDRGLSQMEVAEKIGLSQNSYSRIERGVTRLSVEKIEQIADALGVNFDMILTLSDRTQRAIDADWEDEKIDKYNAMIEENEKLESRIEELESVIEDKTLLIKMLKEKIDLLEDSLYEYIQNEKTKKK